MITDIMALARDVDRLFRARQDGRQMPVGAKDAGFQGILRPANAEERALIMYCDLAVLDDHRIALAYDAKARFRTRRHVAMLALTEPAHFRACLAEMRVHRMGLDISTGPSRHDDVIVYRDGTEVRNGNEWTSVRPAKIAADVARTARYLIDLDARLTGYREAEAQRAAIKAGEREIAEERALAAAAQEPIPQEDEAAIMEMT